MAFPLRRVAKRSVEDEFFDPFPALLAEAHPLPPSGRGAMTWSVEIGDQQGDVVFLGSNELTSIAPKECVC